MTLSLLLSRGLRVLLGLVLGLTVVVGYVAGQVWWVARQDDRRPSDAIVVLGASQYNGRPSDVFRARLDHARTLYAEHVAPRILTVGGGQPGDRTTEAQAGQDYLVAHGVPADAILPLRTGSDTLQSMHAVAAVFRQRGWQTAVLVTDPWHCLRARTMARDSGIDAVTSPERDGPLFSSRGTEVRYIARETLAYLYYTIVGGDGLHSTGAA